MRLIDADELIVMEYGGIRFVPAEFINDAPTIDTVEVIRCKNCKFRLHLQATSCHPEQYLCRLDKMTFYTSRKANNPEWFCGDGKRREE